MSNEIEITTKLCQSQTGVSCNEVVLKIPQTEAVKLQSVAFSGNENSFGFSFGLVLIFYLIAKSVGSVLAIFR